ncbi:unnamed protein product [Polarella glacialis]|uniref:Uncharacterized protein n=1 Tax=Polarella glacialis TaxID=89957 RepID=A0A813H5S1_POLGL|nr:unnamed protein product [Polarella glacialis]
MASAEKVKQALAETNKVLETFVTSIESECAKKIKNAQAENKNLKEITASLEIECAKKVKRAQAETKNVKEMMASMEIEFAKKVNKAQAETKNEKEMMASLEIECAKKVKKAQTETKNAKELTLSLTASLEIECAKKVKKAQTETKNVKELIASLEIECAKKVKNTQTDNKNVKDIMASMEIECSKKVRKAQTETKNVKEILASLEIECSKKVKISDAKLKMLEQNNGLMKTELNQIQKYFDAAEQPQSFKPGDPVVLCGLNSNSGASLNGRLGTVVAVGSIDQGRITVDVQGVGIKAVKIDNVLHKSEAQAGQPSFMSNMKAKLDQMVGGMRVKLRQATSELEHYKAQRHKDVKTKDTEIADLKKKCSQLALDNQKLKGRRLAADIPEDDLLGAVVKLMIKEARLKDADSDPNVKRQLQRCLHPDKNPATKVATKMMQLLSYLW